MTVKNYDYWYRRMLADLRAQEAAIKRHRVRLIDLYETVAGRISATNRGIEALHEAIELLGRMPNVITSSTYLPETADYPPKRPRGRPPNRPRGRPPDQTKWAAERRALMVENLVRRHHERECARRAAD